MYYTYILFINNCEMYKGYTDNLKRRIKEHESGRVYTTRNQNIELIYYEAYVNKKDAMNRERYFKTGWGRIYIRKVLKNHIKNKKLGG